MAQYSLQARDDLAVESQPKQRTVARRIVALLPDAVAIGLLLCLTLLFYWRILIPSPENRGSFPPGDFYEQFYPFAYFRAHELASGRIPLWYPHAFGGGPFVADVQSAVFYPMHWIMTTIGMSRGYPVLALEAEAIGHIFLAALFSYVFARRILLGMEMASIEATRDWPQVVAHEPARAWAQVAAPFTAAAAFAFGGYLTSYPSQQLSILEVQVWLPLILLFLHLATEPERPYCSRLCWSILAGLTLGVSILAGHPQAAMYVIYGTAAFALFRLGCRWADAGRRTALRESPLVLVYIPLGLALAAAQLVPTMEFMRLSTRASASYAYTWWGFPLQDILQIVLPGSVSLMSPMYVGILSLGLVAAVLAQPRYRYPLFWAALAVVSLLISFGGHTFLYSALYVLGPGFALFRDQERAIVLFSFAMAMLAGAGLRYWLSGDPAVSRLLSSLSRRFLAAAAILYLFIWLASNLDAAVGDHLPRASFLLIVASLVAGVCYLKDNGPEWSNSRPKVLSAAAIAILFFDLFTINWQNNLVDTPPQAHFASTPFIDALQHEVGDYRVHNNWELPMNYGAIYNIEDVYGASPLVLKRVRELLDTLPRERMWQLLHVKYLVSWEGEVHDATRLATAPSYHDATREMYLHRLLEPLPRAYVVHASTVADGEAALALLSSDQFELRQTAILPDNPGSLPGGGPSDATVVDRRPGHLVIETAPDRPGILVLSEIHYPGWRATVDGRPAEIFRVNYTLRGIALEPGQHRIVMEFDPASVKIGIGISLAAFAAAISALILLQLRLRRPVGNG